MQLLDVFLTRLLPKVPGCPHPLAFRALVDAAIDFCEDTHVVQLTTTQSNVKANVPQYDVDLPPDTEVVRVLNVWYGTRSLPLAAQSGVDTPLAYNPVAGPDIRPVGEPLVALVTEPLTVSLYPSPAKDGIKMLAVRVATKPTRTATRLDDSLFVNWGEAIVNGAAMRIASQPGESYSSDLEANKAALVYNHYLGRARMESRKGRVRGDTAVRNRPLA